MDIAKQFLSKEHCDYFYSVPSSLVLSVGTESTMKERLEEEYKSKAVRLKTAFKYKGRHVGQPPTATQYITRISISLRNFVEALRHSFG
jgi:hypothetical protein